MRTLRFAATTYDVERWPAAARQAGEAYGDYQDCVFDQLREVMVKAGRDFIDAHPGIFVCELS